MTDQARAGIEKLESLTSDARILDPLRAAVESAAQPQAEPEPEIAEINADEPADFEVEMETADESEAVASSDPCWPGTTQMPQTRLRWNRAGTGTRRSRVRGAGSEPERIGRRSGSFARRFFPASTAARNPASRYPDPYRRWPAAPAARQPAGTARGTYRNSAAPAPCPRSLHRREAPQPLPRLP